MKTSVVRAKPTNITLNPILVDEARNLGINISQACEKGLSETISDEKMRQWNERNAAALEAWGDYVEKHGLPLARHRQF